MFRILKIFLVGSILVLLMIGIGYAGGMNESELVSWEKHFEMIKPLGAGASAGGAHVLMTDTSDVRVGTFTYKEEKAVDIYYPPDMDFNEVRRFDKKRLWSSLPIYRTGAWLGPKCC